MTGKTLKELDVKPGDVVAAQEEYTIWINSVGQYCEADDKRPLSADKPIWHLVSRATPDAPVMTPNPRLTAAVAKLDAKDADTMATVFGYTLRELHNIIAEHERRIAPPKPVRETVTLYWRKGNPAYYIGFGCDTHKITFDLIDGKPDPSSIKMNEVE